MVGEVAAGQQQIRLTAAMGPVEIVHVGNDEDVHGKMGAGLWLYWLLKKAGYSIT